MRILTFGTLRNFWRRHPDSESALDGWYRETRRERWHTPAEVILRHPNASIVGSDRVVFRIKGNAYRLVVRVDTSMDTFISVSSALIRSITASTPRRCKGNGNGAADHPHRGGVPAGRGPD